jgi:hypothetical protein
MKQKLKDVIAFLELLEEKKIVFELDKIRDSICIVAYVPRQIWEIEYMSNGAIEIEKFISDGQIFDETEIDALFREFSECGKSYSLSQKAIQNRTKEKNMYTSEEFFGLLKELSENLLYYEFRRIKTEQCILVEVIVPGQRWEIKYLPDGAVEIEKFMTTITILDEKEIPNLFKHLS